MRLEDDVPLLADYGHPNRCYAWTGELSWTVAAAIAAILRPGDTFLDIGSFCGQHAMRAARLVGTRGRVVAVEPDPRCVAWLRRNLAAADLSEVVRVREVAVVPRPVSGVDLFLDPGISMSSVVGGNGACHRVPAISIDEILSDVGPDLVKFDAEGIDAALLAASERLAASDAPALVVELSAGVREAARQLGYATVDLRAPLTFRERSLYNASPDIVAFKPGRMDQAEFVSRYHEQLSRLRRLPLFRYV